MGNTETYDVIVIGAGPAGAEAAMAAGRAGANTLCLSINLDNVGFPPATPLLVADDQDVRGPMLVELATLGGILPQLLKQEGVPAPSGAAAGHSGRVLIDRRNLGLAYKEALESAENVHLRQALVLTVEAVETPGLQKKADSARWQVKTKLGECFNAGALVVAAGTFLGGKVDDAGVIAPGGRAGEIPANALARTLDGLGCRLTRIFSETPPRIESAPADAAAAGKTDIADTTAAAAVNMATDNDAVKAASDYELLDDGRQLGELMVSGFWSQGNRMEQQQALRETGRWDRAWMTRSSWSVTHLALAAAQVDQSLEALFLEGIFFAGRVAGTCNYVEAAVTGLVAGAGAAARATGRPRPDLIIKSKYVDKICTAVAEQESRPVTIRIAGPGC